jgi:formylglycine-generating enzyme required for sulfatase activity
MEHQSHFSGEELPVERLSLINCMHICNKLSEWLGIEERYRISKRGVTIVEESIGVRIPTESQWMRAAKAGDPYVFSGSINPKLCAWYEENANKQTAPVQQLQPNRFGLYDMSGNVWEWVHNPETNEGHGLGGSFQESYSGIELGARLTIKANASRPDMGFRPLIPISWT